jgi:hypothetical protein
MSQIPTSPPFVKIISGIWSGNQGPIVGIDQQCGMVTVHIRKAGITFGVRHGRNVEFDVRDVRRIER